MPWDCKYSLLSALECAQQQTFRLASVNIGNQDQDTSPQSLENIDVENLKRKDNHHKHQRQNMRFTCQVFKN